MSVVAISDICGRCASRNSSGGKQDDDDDDGTVGAPAGTVRGLVIAALDRRRYLPLVLASGKKVGDGIENWGPAVRAMDLDDLRELLGLLEGKSD
jgi:hypothetical protein